MHPLCILLFLSVVMNVNRNRNKNNTVFKPNLVIKIYLYIHIIFFHNISAIIFYSSISQVSCFSKTLFLNINR